MLADQILRNPRCRAGSGYRAQGLTLPEPALLSAVPIRFGIFDAKQGYHVPLLCTPWSYNTCRGS